MSLVNAVYHIPHSVLEECRSFFQDRGSHDFEGTAILAGVLVSPQKVTITRVVIPEQIATTSEFGCSVELTERAHFTLPDLLLPGQLFFARIHSHPARAYHSSADDSNQILTHQGAISIVVPHFAKLPVDLPRCAIFQLDFKRGWVQLSKREIHSRFEIV
jgi:hypothetical protein